jgi:TolA-binding protein
MDAERIWETYNDHWKVSKSMDLPVEIYVRLASLFCENDHLEDAEKFLNLLLQKKPDHPNLPTTLMRLVKALDKSGSPGKAQSYRKILLEKFPMSPEARLAG